MKLPVAISFTDHLATAGLVPVRDLERVARLQEESGDSLAVLLTRLGLISEVELARHYAAFYDLPLLDAEQLGERFLDCGDVSPAFLRQAGCFPYRLDEERLGLAMRDPHDAYPLQAMEFFTGQPFTRAVATIGDIDSALAKVYERPEATEAAQSLEGDIVDDDIDRLRDLASEAPVIRLVQQLVTQAIERKASDIHIEPLEDRLSVRYRIDGLLQEVESLPAGLRSAVVSRVKILAHLDIAERRLPQDGRIRLTIHGRETDFRVATSPTLHGESVVLRILDRRDVALDFDALGFSQPNRRRLDHALAQPHGIILVTGPTGSGKTTTLYAALKTLNSPDRKILTAEDPIEYTLERVNQTQIKPQIGHDFANALRSFLRQDPDIIMVGEIRDTETARIAIQASLTGHLLLSTLHTNSAAGAVARLIDMGVEEYLLASTLTLVLAQRLVRRLCPACRIADPVPPSLHGEVQRIGIDPASGHIHRPQGCPECKGSGYSGRVAIVELLSIDEAIQALILRRATATEIEKQAVAAGMRTMKMDGLLKALQGLTSMEEVFRVTQTL